ncbi:hypothetical protein RYO59_000189 [Thermosynechococcaceae cyanobacterium Okahandja]
MQLTLSQMKATGYAYVVIGWVCSGAFYAEAVEVANRLSAGIKSALRRLILGYTGIS